MAVKHSTVVTIPDDPNWPVGTGEWNANHTIDNDTITTATIANDAVTYAKMQNVSAASKLVGRGDSGAGDPQEITLGSNLTMTGTTLAATGGSGSPGGASLTIQYNNASAFGGMSGTSWDDTNRSLTVTGATVTTNKPIFDLSQTWNAGGVTFTGIKVNVTNTASATASKPFDFQIGGTSVLRIGSSDGNLVVNQQTSAISTLALAVQFGGSNVFTVGTTTVAILPANGHLDLPNPGNISWGPGFVDLYGIASTYGILEQREATNACTYRVYNTYTDASNYERGVLDWTTNANVLTIGTQKAGTGTARDVNFVGAPNRYNFDTFIQWGGQARVTADFTVTSSTTLVNVTGLSVSVQAGRTYHFETELYVTDAAAGGVQAAIAGTATATAIQYTGYTIADNAIKAKTNATALATAVGSTVTTETAGIIVRITGTITVNAGGTLTVQMAQNTSNGTATTAKRGSYFLVHDMP